MPKGAFEKTATRFLATGAIGFNITLPNKQDAFLFADQLSKEARLAGAVNTIYRDPEGQVFGHNTDGSGLVTDLKANLGWTIAGKKVLIVGAGGAVQGVIGSLLKENPEKLDIYNRTFSRAENLARRFDDERFMAKNIDQLRQPYDLVISGSSAALLGSPDGKELPHQVINAETYCYDMIYGKGKTPFLSWCFERNCGELSDGLGMLVEQAALSFHIWFARKVYTRQVISQLRTTL